MWLVTMEVVLGLECRPIQAWWGAAEGSCLNQVAFGYFTNITNLTSDVSSFWIQFNLQRRGLILPSFDQIVPSVLDSLTHNAADVDLSPSHPHYIAASD